MIFQGSIKLNIPNKNVYAVIDVVTGLLGFVEKVDGNCSEYAYLDASHEVKIALIDKLIPLFDENDKEANVLISNKWGLGHFLMSFNSNRPK